MRARPELVGASHGAPDTDLMRELDGWIAKGGAEGLFCAAHEDGRGVALKTEDGSFRAIRPALGVVFGLDDFRDGSPDQQPRRDRRLHLRMKVFIVSDMEGVAGIVKWQQVTGGHAMYEEGRRLYTGEINAAVRGAKAAGATEIVVMDCHGAGEGWTFNSLIPEELDTDCEYVVQNEWTEYTEYLEQGVDAALFVGMHAMAGTRDGVLAHTVSGSSWWRLRFNGVEVGETGINAALCGTWGCPVLLVTGDEASCREGRALLGDALTTVAVKKGLGRFTARQYPAPKARELIEAGASRRSPISAQSRPTNRARPCEIIVDFNTSDHVEKYRYRAGRRDHRAAPDRLACRRLVDGVAAVLLLAAMAIDEARLEDVGSGLAPVTEGWFVVNAGEAAWVRNDAFGGRCVFESSRRVLAERPGRRTAAIRRDRLHARRARARASRRACTTPSPARKTSSWSRETCLLLIEEQERPLRAWDFVHCPAGTQPHALSAPATSPA